MSTGERRYGESVVSGQRVGNPTELKVIALMLAMRAEGQTYRAIAERLNELGIAPNHGDTWTALSVCTIVLGLES